MSQDTQPNAPRPHSISSASIGSRLTGVPGRGSDLAPLAWFAILVHTPWDETRRPTWASNETLAEETGLPIRDLQYGITRLRDAAMLSTRDGRRPGALRPWGRVLVPHLESPVRVFMPTPEDMAALWRACFQIRKRPAALVVLMVGMFIIASHALGFRPTKLPAQVPGSKANLRRFVGASRGSTFARRFDDLEKAGLISRTHGLEIAPPSKWVVRAPESTRARVSECPPMEQLPDHVLEAMAAAYESEMGVG